jgi:hypothetical protein
MFNQINQGGSSSSSSFTEPASDLCFQYHIIIYNKFIAILVQILLSLLLLLLLLPTTTTITTTITITTVTTITSPYSWLYSAV